MAWFKHHHYWRPKTALNTIHTAGEQRATAGLLVEDCSCGMVRTIEFSPGDAPVVRYAKVEGADKLSSQDR